MCRQGSPEEYAVHVKFCDGLPRLYRLAELPTLSLGEGVDNVSIYRLSGHDYYAKEVITFQPTANEDKAALFSQVKAW